MFHFPRHGVSFALLIIFHLYDDSVQAFSAPSKHSELVMHVGNLDWTVPADAISDLLLTAVGGVTSSAGDRSEETVKVTVKALPTPLRKRDEGKMHGGSAAIEFSSKKDATTAMLKLNSFILARTEEKEDKQWRVRWAYDVPPIIRSHDNTIKEVVLTKERIQLRKNRAEQYARRRKRIAQKTDDLIRLVIASIDDDDENISVGLWSLDGSNVPEILDAPMLDWSQCPDEIDPVRGGGLREGTRRGQRKQSAVEAFLYVLQAALLLDHDASSNGHEDKNVCRRPFVADLGCGGGNLSLPLAWWLQKQGLSGGVVAVDINGFALKILAERASLSGVSIETMEQDLLHLVEQPALQHSSTKERTGIPHDGSDSSTADDRLRLADCAAVVSLHACGAASDLAMAAAISHSLPFALSPCCIGKMNASRQNTKQDAGGRIIGMPKLRSVDRSAAPSEISYPRSELLNDIISVEEYQLLAAAADYGTATNPNTNHDTLEERNRTQRCRKAKTIVELDRLQWAKEQGYVVRMVELPRIGPLYNKRELLLGAKKGTEVATRLSSCLDIISSTPV